MRYHAGLMYPDSPKALTRARFCAFSYRIITFIVDTTHCSSSDYAPRDQMIKALEQNCFDDYEFIRLAFNDQGLGHMMPSLSGDEVCNEYYVHLRNKSNGEPVKFMQCAIF